MNVDALIAVMTGAVVLSALSMLVQAVIGFRIYKTAQSINEKLNALAPRAEAVLANAEKTLEQSRQQVGDVTAKASHVLELAQTQLQRVDLVLSDATGRARTQMDRVELVLDDTIGRLHQTVVELNKGILWPLREVNAVVCGLRAAFQQLLRSGRPDVSRATTDEEMFI